MSCFMTVFKVGWSQTVRPSQLRYTVDTGERKKIESYWQDTTLDGREINDLGKHKSIDYGNHKTRK